jgi:nicotinamidase-related amidase
MIARPFTEHEVLTFAKRAYEEGHATFEVAPHTCALLMIDMQDEFVEPGWPPFWVPEATRQVPRIKRLIEHCRQRDIPVIFTDRFCQDLSLLRSPQEQSVSAQSVCRAGARRPLLVS